MQRVMLPLRRAIGSLLVSNVAGNLAARTFRNRIPHRGLRVDVSSALVTSRTKARLLFHAYESAEYRFMRRYLPTDEDVVELGGSLGVMSCLIRRKLHSSRRLIVVEADPRIAALLRQNLGANGCARGTTVENLAIAADGQDHVTFEIGQASNSGRLATVGNAGERIDVPASTLEALLRRSSVDRYSLMCDIEGAEWELWRNERDTLYRASWVIMETHDHPSFGSAGDLIKEIEADGHFTLVDRYGPVIALHEASFA